jgi:hypothetical protein
VGDTLGFENPKNYKFKNQNALQHLALGSVPTRIPDISNEYIF